MDWRETCSPRAPEGREFSAGQNLPSRLRGTGTVPSPRAPPTPSPVPSPPLPAPPTHPPTHARMHAPTHTHPHPHTHTPTPTHTQARAHAHPDPAPTPISSTSHPPPPPPPHPTPPLPSAPLPSPATRGARGGMAVSAPVLRCPLGNRSRPRRQLAALLLGVRLHQPCPRKARELMDDKERTQKTPKGPPEPNTAMCMDPRRGRGSPHRMHE